MTEGAQQTLDKLARETGTDSALGVALEQAGFRAPGAALARLVAEVLAEAGGDLERALAVFETRARGDAAVLWDLLSADGAPWLRRRLMRALRAGLPARGKRYREDNARVAPRGPGSAPGAASGPLEPKKVMPPPRSIAAMAGVGEVTRRYLWDTLLINGQSLAEVEVGEAKRWAATMGKRAGFVAALCLNQPHNVKLGSVMDRARAVAIERQFWPED